MDMTGWISGQVFFQTVDQTEVEQINAFLTSRGILSQVLTQSEHMMLDPGDRRWASRRSGSASPSSSAASRR